LEDDGLTKGSYGRYVDDVAGRKLHPIQFDELYAKALYQVSRFEGGITYITTRPTAVTQPVRTFLVTNGHLREHSQEEFSHVLKHCVSDWLLDKDKGIEWFVPPNQVRTWMTNEAGALLFRPLDEWETKYSADN
jgi:hypothetical protein